jgi:hypothetical protein
MFFLTLFYAVGVAMGWYLKSKRCPKFKTDDYVQTKDDDGGVVNVIRWSTFHKQWQYQLACTKRSCSWWYWERDLKHV